MALFRPTLQQERLIQLTAEQVQSLGIKALLLDVDNTLSTHHSQVPLPGVEDWIFTMQRAGIKLMIVSNARRTRVEPFAQKLGLPFFWLCKKPLPFHIRKAVSLLQVAPHQAMLCGDQLFTDMPAGHLAGVRTLLVSPAQPEQGLSFKIRRTLEKPLLRRYSRKESAV